MNGQHNKKEGILFRHLFLLYKVNFILDENLLKLFVILVERKIYGS